MIIQFIMENTETPLTGDLTNNFLKTAKLGMQMDFLSFPPSRALKRPRGFNFGAEIERRLCGRNHMHIFRAQQVGSDKENKQVSC